MAALPSDPGYGTSAFGDNGVFNVVRITIRTINAFATRAVYYVTTLVSSVLGGYADSFREFARRARASCLEFSLGVEEVVLQRPGAALRRLEPAMVGGGPMFRRWR